MDENLGYSSEDNDEKRVSSSQWQLTNESFLDLERESSKLFLQYRNYHLHLIQKREPPCNRLIIPATKSERLCYFRHYVSSPNKTQIACMHQNSFNTFFWQYIMNSLNKSLPHTFVNIFLASYVPEEHLFLSKMVPLMHGIKFAFILTGLLEVTKYISSSIILFDYLVGSIFLKNPWNRCPISGKYYYSLSKYPNKTVAIKCYNVMDFGNRVRNKTVIFHKRFYYIPEDSEMLQLVQIEYFRYRLMTMPGFVEQIYTLIMWGLIFVCCNQIFKRNFWKFFSIIHWCVIAIDIVTFGYVIFYNFNEENNYVPTIAQMETSAYAHIFSFVDLDFLAESTTAPPVVHVLTARSTQEILPGRDSALIVLSNAICFLFRGLLSYKVKQHCERLVNVPIVLPGVVTSAWLYFWPMYFSTFFLGDIYTLFFLLFHFAMEIMTTVVTFQCLVEAVVSEWPKLQRWLVFVIFFIVDMGMTAVPVNLTSVVTYNKSTVTLIECIVLYWLYPLFRLADDIFFHYGSPPHVIRMSLLWAAPFYYLAKYYNLMTFSVYSLLQISFLNKKDTYSIKHSLVWSFSLIIVPILLGIVYITYTHIWKGTRNWKCMFAPTEDWGPRDYNTRQLRKDYDSRTYNSSEAPRKLSRYIISRAESKAYRLDIRYDPNRRSTIVVPNEYKIESEKTS